MNNEYQALTFDAELTAEQQTTLKQMITFTQTAMTQPEHAVFVLQGEAGTGKSVLLNHFFAQMAQKVEAPRFLVNHPELLKVYRQIAGATPGLLKKFFERPTTFINKAHKQNTQVDLAVIDEAHLLLSKADHYNNYYGNNQLADIINLSHVTILVFDPEQVLKTKSYWTTKRLQQVIGERPQQWVQLQQQFRLQAPVELLNWLNDFVSGEIIKPIELPATDYDFRVYDDAEAMRQQIVARNQEVGMARITATSGYPSTLDGGKHYITEGQFKLPWDQYNFTSIPWAEQPQTIDEVGSIYTVQGFDLSYIGIIIGPPFYLTADKRLGVNPELATDVEVFKHRADLSGTDYENSKVALLRNSLNVLLKRGVKGTYLYAHDPKLRDWLNQQENASR